MRFGRWLYWWGPALALMLVIFVASGTPGNSIPDFKGWVDLLAKKGGHVIGYGALALAYRRAWARGAPPRAGTSAVSWGMALAYALTDEFHQSFTPGRGPQAADVAMDAAAAAAALLLAHAWSRRPMKREA